LKANHNVHQTKFDFVPVVIKERKSKVWKQITTITFINTFDAKLLSKNVNLKFESKSQLTKYVKNLVAGCYQRT